METQISLALLVATATANLGAIVLNFLLVFLLRLHVMHLHLHILLVSSAGSWKTSGRSPHHHRSLGAASCSAACRELSHHESRQSRIVSTAACSTLDVLEYFGVQFSRHVVHPHHDKYRGRTPGRPSAVKL